MKWRYETAVHSRDLREVLREDEGPEFSENGPWDRVLTTHYGESCGHYHLLDDPDAIPIRSFFEIKERVGDVSVSSVTAGIIRP